MAGSHSGPQALLALSFQEWILCDDKWTLLMEVTFVLNFHLRLSGCICSFLHAALCFRVLISLVLVLAPLSGCSSCRWLYPPCTGVKAGDGKLALVQHQGVQPGLGTWVNRVVSCFHVRSFPRHSDADGTRCASAVLGSWRVVSGVKWLRLPCWTEAAPGRDADGDNPGVSDSNSRSGIRWLAGECH